MYVCMYVSVYLSTYPSYHGQCMAIGVRKAGRETALSLFHSWQDPTSPKEEESLQEHGRVSGHGLED